MNRPARFESPRGLRMIGRIVALLKASTVPMSTEEIADELFCTAENARQYLVHLTGLKENRQVRISAWRQSGTRWVALHKLGSGPNKRKPKPLSRSDLHRNMMADPVARAKETTYRRNWRRAKRGLPPLIPAPAPWCALVPVACGGA